MSHFPKAVVLWISCDFICTSGMQRRYCMCKWAAAESVETCLALEPCPVPGRTQGWCCRLKTQLCGWAIIYFLHQDHMTSKCCFGFFPKPRTIFFSNPPKKLPSTKPTSYQFLFLWPSGRKEPGGETSTVPAKIRCWRITRLLYGICSWATLSLSTVLRVGLLQGLLRIRPHS